MVGSQVDKLTSFVGVTRGDCRLLFYVSEQEGSICAQSEPIVSEVSATDATVLFGVLLNNHSNFHPFLSRFKVVVEKGGD